MVDGEPISNSHRGAGESLVRVLLFIAGTIFLVLGIIGVVLPILPTTPFLLLSAACYLRSSTRAHHWLYNNRVFGNYLRNYRDRKGLPLRAKIITISLLWAAISYSAFFIVNLLAVQVLLFIIAVAVSAHLISLPTIR